MLTFACGNAHLDTASQSTQTLAEAAWHILRHFYGCCAIVHAMEADLGTADREPIEEGRAEEQEQSAQSPPSFWLLAFTGL